MVTKSKRYSRYSADKIIPSSVIAPATAAASIPANGNSTPVQTGSHDYLRDLYSALLRYRTTKNRSLALLRERQGSVSHDGTKHHEAVIVGAAVHLRPSDTMVASPQNLSAQIVAGNLPPALAAGDGNSGHHAFIGQHVAHGQLALAPDSLQLLNFAGGLGLAHKWEKKGNVVVVFSDAGVPSLANTRDALRFAGKHRLPILYVLESAWPKRARADEDDAAMQVITAIADDYGFPGIIVDGDDMAAVWRVAQECIHRARLGTGPTLLDCKTALHSPEDPLARLERYMRKRGSWEDAWRRELGRHPEAEQEHASVLAVD